MGSFFLPFLRIGITIEYFILSGKMPVAMTLLQMYVRGDDMYIALSVRMYGLISSYPKEFLVFSDFIILIISVDVDIIY